MSSGWQPCDYSRVKVSRLRSSLEKASTRAQPLIVTTFGMHTCGQRRNASRTSDREMAQELHALQLKASLLMTSRHLRCRSALPGSALLNREAITSGNVIAGFCFCTNLMGCPKMLSFFFHRFSAPSAHSPAAWP